MSRVVFALNVYLRARRADVARGAVMLAVAAQHLRFYRNGEVLVDVHCFGSLGVEHGTAVAICPFGITGKLFAREAVFHPQLVMRIRLVGKDMPEAVVKRIVAVVAHFEQSVFHAEGVAEVLAGRVAGDFHCPSVQVFPVEKGFPLRFVSSRSDRFVGSLVSASREAAYGGCHT
ncbi:hypothetical protein Barb4_03416 [Bacteroidales bacterium Barb4]|nr:hypothetical protein Barb4_03416 [Bacteroidales bacterium Barb4]